ncbi:hypothetical protein GM182_06295 [bacterium 3DAC]|nr:hypothetical protein GM182_06295 [bacterium 3DAC]
MKKVGYILAFILAMIIALAGGIMWYHNYPSTSLCNIITPSMGTRDLPLIYPTKTGVLGSLSLSFHYTSNIPTEALCGPIEPFTPTTKLVGDVLSGAPSFIHGLICPNSAYNYSAFAHLVSGPYTEKRAYTDPNLSLLYRLIGHIGDGRLYVTENKPADINVYITSNNICVSGKVKTSPRKLLPTISALIGIPYPIWGEEPDWNILSGYYPDDEITLMKIRYLELLAYRVEYLSLLDGKPTDYRQMYIVPYLYQIEGFYQKSASITQHNITTLKEQNMELISQYESHMRKRRVFSLLIGLLLVVIIILGYFWESVVGIAAGLAIIAISPGMQIGYLMLTLFIMYLVVIFFCLWAIKKNVAITLSVMAITLFAPTIVVITWLGVLPLLKEPSPFMAHLMSLTIPSATITSITTLLAFFIQELVTSIRAQHTHREQQPEH